jgi:phosphoenolpyruvate synthase/pyruvate phosphate dikinase
MQKSQTPCSLLILLQIENVVLIEAIWGLGESIVAGEVSPHSYKVSKDIDEREEGEEIETRSEAIIDVRFPAKQRCAYMMICQI